MPHTGELYTLLVGAMAQVNDPRSPVASANGQWLLLRRAPYAAVGGQAAVRGAIAEDLALARRLKAAGARIRMAHAPNWSTAGSTPASRPSGAASARRSFPPPTAASPAAPRRRRADALWGRAGGRLFAGAGGGGLARRSAARKAAGRRRLAHALAQLGPQWLVRAWIARRLGLSPLYAFTYRWPCCWATACSSGRPRRYLRGRGPAWKGRTYGA